MMRQLLSALIAFGLFTVSSSASAITVEELALEVQALKAELAKTNARNQKLEAKLAKVDGWIADNGEYTLAISELMGQWFPFLFEQALNMSALEGVVEVIEPENPGVPPILQINTDMVVKGQTDMQTGAIVHGEFIWYDFQGLYHSISGWFALVFGPKIVGP